MFAVALCFVLSGMGSLVLEVAWTRMLRLVFGSTTLAASTVLVAYMAGLGVGAWLGGRIARRLANGVRAYALLELGIAVYALAVPFALAGFPLLAERWLYTLPFWGAASVRFALALVLLAPPTLCMGMTLPILVEATVHDRARAGEAIALLYGVNTLGAVLGVFSATFLLFPSVGLHGASYAGAALDAVAGVLALALVRGRTRAPAAEPGPLALAAAAPRATAALVAYAVVGFGALVCEVAWTRLLAMVLGSSIYAFASMLGAFLAGIALGSLAARRWLDRIARPELAYALGIAATGLLSLATFALLPVLPDLFIGAVRRFGTTGGALTAIQVGISLGLMLPPTLVLGALFPLLARVLAARGPGAAVGQVYFANTMGAALGAFGAGFVLIPGIGVRRTLGLAVALQLVAAAALLLRVTDARLRVRALGAAALGAVAVWLLVAPPAWDPRGYAEGAFIKGRIFEEGFDPALLEGVARQRLVYYRDGLNSTVSVVDYRGNRTLYVNGKPDASSVFDMPTQVLLAHVALLFGPPAERVLVIGFASGVTVGSALRHPLRALDAVELEPAALEASRYFDAVNGRPLEDPRTRVRLDDGRSVLAYGRERYDLVISEPSNPWFTGVANLFTQEFFAAAKRSLVPGGRLLQWVQLYAIDAPTLKAVLAALRAEFPHVYGFAVTEDIADLHLLAMQEPLSAASLPRFEVLPERVRSDLSRVGVHSTAQLWSLVRLVPQDVDRLAAGAPAVNRDDNLFVELRSPWNLYGTEGERTVALIDEAGSGVLPILEGSAAAADPAVLGELALAYARDRAAPQIARKLVERADALGPSAHADAARALLQREVAPDVRRALLDSAVERAPAAVALRDLRAGVRLERGDLDGALADADAALAARPGHGPALLLRVKLLYGLGRFAEAAAASDRLLATEYAALQPEAWLFAGQSYLEAGRAEDAARELERYVEAEPGWHVAWERLALACERSGRPADAERARHNQGRNLWMLARTAAERGDLVRAFGLLRRALELEPDHAPARATLADLEGRWARATGGAPTP